MKKELKAIKKVREQKKDICAMVEKELFYLILNNEYVFYEIFHITGFKFACIEEYNDVLNFIKDYFAKTNVDEFSKKYKELAIDYIKNNLGEKEVEKITTQFNFPKFLQIEYVEIAVENIKKYANTYKRIELEEQFLSECNNDKKTEILRKVIELDNIKW